MAKQALEPTAESKGVVTVDDIEHRTERRSANPRGRPYGECSPSKLLHWNGSRMAAQDRALVAAMARALLAQDQQGASDWVAEQEQEGAK